MLNTLKAPPSATRLRTVLARNRSGALIMLLALSASCLGVCGKPYPDRQRKLYHSEQNGVRLTVLAHLGLRMPETSLVSGPRNPAVVLECASNCASTAKGPIPSLDIHVKLAGAAAPSVCTGSSSCNGLVCNTTSECLNPGPERVFARWGPQVADREDETLPRALKRMKVVHCQRGERHAFVVDAGDHSHHFEPFGVYIWKGYSWLTGLTRAPDGPTTCESVLQTMTPAAQLVKRYDDPCRFFEKFDDESQPSQCKPSKKSDAH